MYLLNFLLLFSFLIFILFFVAYFFLSIFTFFSHFLYSIPFPLVTSHLCFPGLLPSFPTHIFFSSLLLLHLSFLLSPASFPSNSTTFLSPSLLIHSFLTTFLHLFIPSVSPPISHHSISLLPSSLYPSCLSSSSSLLHCLISTSLHLHPFSPPLPACFASDPYLFVGTRWSYLYLFVLPFLRLVSFSSRCYLIFFSFSHAVNPLSELIYFFFFPFSIRPSFYFSLVFLCFLNHHHSFL